MLSWLRVWMLLPSGMWRRVVCYKCTSVSEEPTVSTTIYTDDGGRWFFCNVGKLIPECTALHTRRNQSSLLELAGRREFLVGIWWKESSNRLSAQRYSHLKITYKLRSYCVIHLSLFAVCYIELCCGKYQEFCNYRRRSQIIRRLPEAVPDFSRFKLENLLPSSLIHFQCYFEHSGKVKYNSGTLRT